MFLPHWYTTVPSQLSKHLRNWRSIAPSNSQARIAGARYWSEPRPLQRSQDRR